MAQHDDISRRLVPSKPLFFLFVHHRLTAVLAVVLLGVCILVPQLVGFGSKFYFQVFARIQ